MRVNIITSQKRFTRGFNDFHPIYKWWEEIKDIGIEVQFYRDNVVETTGDFAIIDYRYVRTIFGDWTIEAKEYTLGRL